MHPFVPWSIIYNSQDLEAAQVPINRWMDKKVVGHLHNEMLLGHKKEGSLTIYNTMDGPRVNYAMWNKPVREREVPYDFTHIWNLINKINYHKIADPSTENTLTADSYQWGGSLQGWVKKMKPLRKKEKTHKYRQEYGDDQRVIRCMWKRGINGDGRKLDLGW